MLLVPGTYESSGQELGETRTAMAKGLMKYLEGVIEKYKDLREKYWVLVHAKPFPNKPNMIKQKFVIIKGKKPPMMLSCMLFGVDNTEGKLTLEWALPGDWPVWSVQGTNEPIPEVVGYLNELGKLHNLNETVIYGQEAV